MLQVAAAATWEYAMTNHELRTMELDVTGLSDHQVSHLRRCEVALLQAVADYDVPAWSRALRRIMVMYPNSIRGPIKVMPDFMEEIEHHIWGANFPHDVRKQDNCVKFRGVPVVAAAATIEWPKWSDQ
jgi:hypothetical protein